MAFLEVRDDALWFSHIDDQRIVSILSALEDDEIISLVTAEILGFWARMQQGGNVVPTPGLKPADEETRSWWAAQQGQRGARVSIRLARSSDLVAWRSRT
jgi:hypothetical protein